jgi:hypothetical protein
LIQLCDANNKALADCFIENPFLQQMDVYSPDGSITKKEVKFEINTVNLRIQKTSADITKCKIFELLPNQQYQYIDALILTP